jgi:hypothetical protein
MEGEKEIESRPKMKWREANKDGRRKEKKGEKSCLAPRGKNMQH